MTAATRTSLELPATLDAGAFMVRRVRCEFARGFSSVPYLRGEAEPHDLNRVERLRRLIKNIQDGSFSQLLHRGEWAEHDCVYIAGGNKAGVDAEMLSREVELPVFINEDGRFAGESGGRLWLELHGAEGMVCDLGQTGLKVSWAGRRWVFDRDFSRLPKRQPNEDVAMKGAQRRELRKFIGEALGGVIAEAGAGNPESFVFALPSALDKWGHPAGSSYIGMSYDTQLTPDALEIAGVTSGNIWLLNDAELAALSALADERLEDFDQILVITLGFAIGTATADSLQFAMHLANYMGSEPEPAV